MDVCAIPLASRRINSALINIGRGPRFKRARSSNFKCRNDPDIRFYMCRRRSDKLERAELTVVDACRSESHGGNAFVTSHRSPLSVQPSEIRRARGHVAGTTTAYWNAGIPSPRLATSDAPQIANIKHCSNIVTMSQCYCNVAML